MLFQIKDLLSYARRVKNTRLVLFSRDVPSENFLKFLRNKHRYRDIAVVEKDKYKGRCFKLYKPDMELKISISDSLLAMAVASSILLLSPLVLLQQEKEIDRFVVWRRHGRWKNSSDFLRHVRIAEYAMIDLVEKVLSQEVAVKDGEKRFWRLEDVGDVPLIDYLLVNGMFLVVLYVL